MCVSVTARELCRVATDSVFLTPFMELSLTTRSRSLDKVQNEYDTKSDGSLMRSTGRLHVFIGRESMQQLPETLNS